VSALDPFEQVLVDIDGAQAQKRGRHPRLRVTGMPGKHVPPNPIVEKLNALANAVGSSDLSVSQLSCVRSRLRTAGCSS
jgi:hypothetical protein